MKTKQALLYLGAAAMLAAPVAAQAGTKAADSKIAFGQLSTKSATGQRSSTRVQAKNKADASSLFIVGALGVAAGYGLHEIVNNDDKSKGG